MHRKWKSVAALGMAVLLGCLMPMNTILAAEDDAEVVQEIGADSVTDADEVSDDEAISDDNEIIDEEENAVDTEAGDEEKTDDENVADTDIDGNDGIALMSETDGPEAGDAAVQSAAPVINITLNGESCKVDGLGGDIDYKYTNSSNPKLELSVSPEINFCYWLDGDPGDKVKDDIKWSDECGPSVTHELSSNKTYVVYVKAEADGQTVYARSCGIVVDTIAPQIEGVEEGKTYMQETVFTVKDANLDVVRINGSIVTPEPDGSYRVRTEGAVCLISAKDKAGNEKTCSITASGEKPIETTAISANGIYSLKPGVPYQLAEGQWQISGDSTVYQGGGTFYVMLSDNYRFTKR